MDEEKSSCSASLNKSKSRKKVAKNTDKAKTVKSKLTALSNTSKKTETNNEPSKTPTDDPILSKSTSEQTSIDSYAKAVDNESSKLPAEVPITTTHATKQNSDEPCLTECKPISSRGFLPSITTAEEEEVDNPVKPGYERFYGPFNLDNLNRSQYNNLKIAEIVTGFKHDIIYTETHDDGKSHGICMKISASELKKNKKSSKFPICFFLFITLLTQLSKMPFSFL